MSIRSALQNYLASQPAITALVGTTPPRICPVKLPQGTARPAVLYRRVTGGHAERLTGSAGHALGRFRLDAAGDTYAAADALAEVIRAAMQGFGPGTMAGADVRAVILDDEQDEFDDPIDGGDTGIFYVSIFYLIRYSESIPTP